jgi:hypothetical protein
MHLLARSAIRRIDETEINSGLSSPNPDLSRIQEWRIQERRKLETSAGPGDGITAKRDRPKILGGVSQSWHGRSGRDT